jgi:hypothetical protein
MLLSKGSVSLPLVIFQLERSMERKTRMSMAKRRVMEQTIPSLRTGTASMNTTVYRNHGSGNLHKYKHIKKYCRVLLEYHTDNYLYRSE